MFSKKIFAWVIFPFIAPLPAFSAENAPIPPQEQNDSAPISRLPEKGLPATWIQGAPIKQWEKDKVYVFEFWATWCGPCISAIPHLDAVHKQICAKNIPAQIIGVNIKDRHTPAKLKKFLAEQPVSPGYAIAVDTDKSTENLWLRPRKVIGIPHAIAIKNGNVIWYGHPVRLTAELVEQMTSPDFVAETHSKETKKENANALRLRLAKISELYAIGKTALAERELRAILDDKAVPVSVKQKALELPCLAALSREDYRKMNACLRRKAEAFPQVPENLHDVACFILETDDIPASELDLALAEECLKKSLALSANVPSLKQLHRRQLRMLGELYALRGDKGSVSEMRQASWLASPECDWLIRIEKKLKEDPKTAGALKIYTALADGSATLPYDFTEASMLPKKEVPAPEPIPEFEVSSSPESATMLSFFNSLEWIRGSAPKSLPANGIVAVNFWVPPSPGPKNPIMFRPAEWLDEKISGREESIPVFVVAVENNPGRARKVLNFPRYKTRFPVGVISRKEFLSGFGKTLEAQDLPTTLILRDGKIIWQGRAQDLPDWIVKQASLPNYDPAQAEAERNEEREIYRKKLRRLRSLRQIKGNDDIEAENALKDFREELKKFPSIYMRVTGMLSEAAYRRKDFVSVGKLSEEIIKAYPNVDYIAKMQLNVLNSDLDLRAVNLPVAILAYRNIIGSGDPDSSAYWQAISQVYAEMGEWENAVYAAFAARNATNEWKALRNKL